MTLPVWRANVLATLYKYDCLHRFDFFLPIRNCISGAIWNRASVFAPKINFFCKMTIINKKNFISKNMKKSVSKITGHVKMMHHKNNTGGKLYGVDHWSVAEITG